MFFWAVSVFLSGGTSTYTKSDFRINENQSKKGFKSSATRHISSFFSNFFKPYLTNFHVNNPFHHYSQNPNSRPHFSLKASGYYVWFQAEIYIIEFFVLFWDGLFFFLSFFKYDKLNYSNARIVSFFKDLSYTHIL